MHKYFNQETIDYINSIKRYYEKDLNNTLGDNSGELIALDRIFVINFNIFREYPIRIGSHR